MAWSLWITVIVLVLYIVYAVIAAGRIVASAVEKLAPRSKSWAEEQRERELIEAVKALKHLDFHKPTTLYKGDFDPVKVSAYAWIKCVWDYETQGYDFKERDEFLSQGYKVVLMTADMEFALVKESPS
jgi:hypothetical protein